MFFYSSRAHESTSSLPSPTVYIMNDEKEDFEVFKIPKTDKNNETHEKGFLHSFGVFALFVIKTSIF